MSLMPSSKSSLQNITTAIAGSESSLKRLGIDELKQQSLKNDIGTLLTLDGYINELFKEHTGDFKEKAIQKRKLKAAFFWIISCLMIFLVGVPCIAIPILLRNSNLSTPEIIAAICAGCANILTALIAIPLIIAKYLFNRKEDELHMDLVMQILRHNQSRHEDITKK